MDYEGQQYGGRMVNTFSNESYSHRCGWFKKNDGMTNSFVVFVRAKTPVLIAVELGYLQSLWATLMVADLRGTMRVASGAHFKNSTIQFPRIATTSQTASQMVAPQETAVEMVVGCYVSEDLNFSADLAVDNNGQVVNFINSATGTAAYAIHVLQVGKAGWRRKNQQS
ncbi:hypothetical protein Fot_43016 [Forsythia ovata]|uniref:Uncharacterized protein n=1 Tax=Forsythia ovata TaxID=205694 RepID=A0ABD1RMU2_9LAMI